MSISTSQQIDVSIVVPVYNEEENVRLLYQKVVDAIPNAILWELIFVDDGSADDTVLQLTRIVSKDNRVKAIELRCNAGQTPAMVAGIDYAKGDIIITMDGDLQNDPIDIPRFLNKIEEGFDIVVGWREKRQDALISRKIPSKIANAIIGKITGVPIKDNGCSLKAYRSDLIKQIGLYSEMHRFIPAMASIAGSRVHEMSVKHHPRVHGESKYGLKRIYKVILDLVVVKTLLTSIGSPLKFFAKLATGPILIGFLAAAFFVSGLVDGTANPVVLGIGLIWSITGVFILGAGLLTELLYHTDPRKEVHLASLTLEVSE